MKKRLFYKLSTCFTIPLIACSLAAITSCSPIKRSEIKKIDGTNWVGVTNGFYTPDDYYVDPINKEVTYLNSARIWASNLVVPNYVAINKEPYKVLIANDCFNANHYISGTVELNDFITEIPNRCFKGCDRITSVIFHDYPTNIGDEAFDSSSLASISVLDDGEQKDNWTLFLQTVGSRAFASTPFKGDLIFYDPLTSIGESAFEECYSITNLNLQFAGITTIPNRAFHHCSSLKFVYLSKTIETFGDNSFDLCTGLNTVVFPKDYDKKVTFGKEVFAEDTLLSSITPQIKIASMGERCFSNTNITSFLWNATSGSIDDSFVIADSAFATCPFTWLKFNDDNNGGPADVLDNAFINCASVVKIDFTDFIHSVPHWKGHQIFNGVYQKGIVIIYKNANLNEWKVYLEQHGGLTFDDNHWQIKNQEQ